MNKTIAVSGLFFTVIALIAMPCLAEQVQKPAAKPDFIKTLDKNADSKVSKEEFFAAMEKKFQSMDVDKSENISVQELKVYGEKDPAAIKKAQQTAQAEMTPLDKKIALEMAYDRELIYGEWDAPKMVSESPPQAPVISPSAPSDKTDAKQKLINSFFVGIDANNDGKISTAEKNAAFERLFNRLDSNHNQFISVDEIIAGRHQTTPNTP